MRRLFIMLFWLCAAVVQGQEGFVSIEGRVVCGGRGVPYATLQVEGTSIGVASNDDGRYELRVPAAHAADTVVVRSVGYVPRRVAVADLARHGRVRMEESCVVLGEVRVKGYRSAFHLLRSAVKKIEENYMNHMSWPTFFYRDWRTLDGELYLFDEAVMRLFRMPYGSFNYKRGYANSAERRDLESDYKTLLRHRLVVYDRERLAAALPSAAGVDQVLEYADNEMFYDPVEAPRASYVLSEFFIPQFKYEPIEELVAGGVGYYRLRALGYGRMPKAKVEYVYLVRKEDLAIVSITSSQRPATRTAPDEEWVAHWYNSMSVDVDSSSWSYDVRDGRYTLTHYFNRKVYTLRSKGRGHDGESQRWERCIAWTMTDHTTERPAGNADTIAVVPQTLASVFGQSDYSADYWGHYNSIVLDTLPARLLMQYLKQHKP